MRVSACLPTLTLALALSAAAQVPTGAALVDSRPWLAERALWEERLLTADILGVEDVGQGVTNPKKVSLRIADLGFHAVFKPIVRGRHKGFWESYQAEVAAYELDKILGLDMVPPTVIRRVGPNRGSLQLWIEGCDTYKRLGEKVPRSARFSQQISRMKMFDHLIHNDDRNAGNFLLDGGWNVVLIDHSRAFLQRKDLLEGRGKEPAQYDRRLVERLRELDEAVLNDALGELLLKGQVGSILERRDRILLHLESLIAERGEQAVLFDFH